MSNINITPFYSKGYENAELINIQNKDGVAVVSSRVVAYDFDKQHNHVLRDIDNIKATNTIQDWTLLFIESQYKASNGKMNKEYLLTRDGFSLLVMGFTGKEALQWKLQYIEAFNKMEEQIKQASHNPYANLSPELQMLIKLEQGQTVLNQRVDEQKQDFVEFKQEFQNFKEEQYIAQAQCKQISNRVKSLGTKLLGGKKSPAYQDKSLRAQVYSDIYSQVHREFGVKSCADIKCKDYSAVFSVIHNYSLPMHLLNDIEYAINQMSLEI